MLAKLAEDLMSMIVAKCGRRVSIDVVKQLLMWEAGLIDAQISEANIRYIIDDFGVRHAFDEYLCITRGTIS